MAITDWPTHERPREKLLLRGPQALSDAELLAIFLRTGVSGKSAVDVARELLLEYGSLRKLFEASQQRFCQSLGLGPAKYIQLQAVLEMGKRHLQESLQRGDMLNNPDDTRKFLTARLRDYSYEVFACLYMDKRNRIISFDEMFRGTIDGASVHPREVVKQALAYNASTVIFAHNHPSGIAEPSQSDKSLTQRLKHALSLVDIRVVDHFIIGDGQLVSLAERGML